MMAIIAAFILIIHLAVVLIALTSSGIKWIVTVITSAGLSVLSSIPAVRALGGTSSEYILPGSLVTGEIPVRIDGLSGFFILIINFTFLTGSLYGCQSMKVYKSQSANMSWHCISFLLVHAGLIGICSLQNAIAFLTSWEVMALGSFILIIFEHGKRETLNAGINFLIQSHVCIMFLTLGFVWVFIRTNSFDFKAIHSLSRSGSLFTGVALFSCFFIGFAFKAGFVPFHTWLPYAHPAAPAHVSGIMSGVIIKIGIYGILRMISLIRADYTLIGYIIFFLSLVTGIYGVMLAIIQHNLKRLLAYHSIENIGIIGIGIGIGCIGMGKGNEILTALGFTGAMLHTLNHSLFKSLLFYGAGNVSQATHTMDIEKLGGLGQQMPHTAFLFLIASLAICGLPPLNGFVSEFVIYSGMFSGLHGTDKTISSGIVCGLFGLALIGGLAMLCFTKAFGTVFLGTARQPLVHSPHEASLSKLCPMYLALPPMLAIGLLPTFFIGIFSVPLKLITKNTMNDSISLPFSSIQASAMIGQCAFAFIFLSGLLYYVRRILTRGKLQTANVTWSCGYTGSTQKMQYTASSFIRSYRKLAEPFLSIHTRKKNISKIFPEDGGQETHPYDKSEQWLIDYPLLMLKSFFNRFTFLQNGNLQFYILYGIVFISLVIGIPFAIGYIKWVIDFLSKL
jgi:formate hydrogenlyase subunit 3/multisubunit Na+/H+ antiporter MnhD subunit